MKAIFSDEFVSLLKETWSNYKILILDFLISIFISITLILKRDDVLKLKFKTILLLIIGILVAHFFSNLIKVYFRKKQDSEKKNLDFKKSLNRIIRSYGNQFNKLLNDEVRTTIYEEKMIDKQLYLVIAERFNTYLNDDSSTKWKISHQSNEQCEGIAGLAWSQEQAIKRPRLKGRDKLNALLLSRNEVENRELNDELSKLNMAIEELRVRISLPNRKYLFPKFMYAVSVPLDNNKRLVIAIDSDSRNTTFRNNFEEKVEELRFVLSNVWHQS